MRGGGSKKGFIYKNNILNYENIEKGMLPKMQKTIEVVYENEVFKPLEKVELREGLKAKVTIEKEKGIITLEDIKELEESIKTLPKSKIRLKRIDEIYYEGKMLD